MKEQELVITCYQCFSIEEAERFFRGRISILNWELLVRHITVPDLAKDIEGFTEQDGVLFLMVGGEMMSVTNNLNHPRYSN